MDDSARWLLGFLNENQLIESWTGNSPVDFNKDSFRLRTDPFSKLEQQKLGSILFQAAKSSTL